MSYSWPSVQPSSENQPLSEEASQVIFVLHETIASVHPAKTYPHALILRPGRNQSRRPLPLFVRVALFLVAAEAGFVSILYLLWRFLWMRS